VSGRASRPNDYPAAKAVFDTAELTDGDPAWDRDRSCLDLGDNVGPAVFVTAPGLAPRVADMTAAGRAFAAPRSEIGIIHHHIAGPYFAAYVAEMAWREDNRAGFECGSGMRPRNQHGD
jgi:hypothetical protein